MIGLLVPVGILALASLTALSSISLHLFSLQLVWFSLGIALVFLFWLIDWRSIVHYRWFILGLYLATVALLLFVYLNGPVIRNTRSWFVFGPLNFQPVELVKVSLILIYANYFSRGHVSIARWQNIFMSFFYFIVPAVFVMLQPDFGSALVLFGIWFGFLLVSGIPRRRLVIAFMTLLVTGFLMWHYGLAEYQRERIIGVFYPERNALSINYSVIQSKIAIGSAGFFGKGYGQGSQTQLGFLTEPATDFIYAAFVEEWGWAAGIVIIIVFLALIMNILKIGLVADQNFEKFLCLGAAIVFGWQFLLNAGSTTGLLPVVGVTFPFLSYGGSSLLTSFLLLSIINAVAIRS